MLMDLVLQTWLDLIKARIKDGFGWDHVLISNLRRLVHPLHTYEYKQYRTIRLKFFLVHIYLCVPLCMHSQCSSQLGTEQRRRSSVV